MNKEDYSKIFSFCPIPEDQKPMNQFIRFRQEKNINWTLFSSEKYYRTIFQSGLNTFFITCLTRILYITPKTWNFLVTEVKGLFLSETFTLSNQKLGIFFLERFTIKIICQNLCITFCILLVFFTFFFRFWKTIKTDLERSYLLYEEGSWYQTDTWEKPFFLIKSDRVVSTQKVVPIVKRLSYTFLFVVFGSFFFFLLGTYLPI